VHNLPEISVVKRNIQNLKDLAMNCAKIIFSQHAFTRMFERKLTPDLVVRATRAGDVIASYPDDQPYPSLLLLYTERGRVLHLVVGEHKETETCYIITVYIPDAQLWNADFRTRRPK
jgi:hypothetical protein